MSIVGGTASEIGGGKFSNGAWGSLFQYMFNDLTLSESFAKLWNRKGEIWSDIGQGFEGGLEGYREMKQNAPIYARLLYEIPLTGMEMAVTKNFVTGVDNIYDFTSGMTFDTIPLTSGYGTAGYYTKQYIDMTFSKENYELKNLVPF